MLAYSLDLTSRRSEALFTLGYISKTQSIRTIIRSKIRKSQTG